MKTKIWKVRHWPPSNNGNSDEHGKSYPTVDLGHMATTNRNNALWFAMQQKQQEHEKHIVQQQDGALPTFYRKRALAFRNQVHYLRQSLSCLLRSAKFEKQCVGVVN